MKISSTRTTLLAMDTTRRKQQEELQPQQSTIPRYSGHSSLPNPPHRQLVFPWGQATQHPEWRKLVGEVCFGCYLDSVDVRQCVLQLCACVESAFIISLLKTLKSNSSLSHVRHENELFGNIKHSPLLTSCRVIARVANLQAV